MTPSAFVAFCLGMVVDVLRLFEQSRDHRGVARSRADEGLIGLPWLSRERALMMIAGAVAIFLIGIFKLIEYPSRRATLDTVAVGLPMGLVVFFVLFYGLVSPRLLPKVNEAAILATHTAVVLGLSLHADWISGPFLIGLAVPTVALLIVALRAGTRPPLVKALAYLWYLVGLVVLTVQNGTLALLNQTDLSIVDAFIVGATLILLALHGFFFIRFFLMMSALILPRHRPYMTQAIPHLFKDDQAPTWQILALEGLVIVPLLANALFDLAPSLTLINGLVLLIIQGPNLSVETPFAQLVRAKVSPDQQR